MIEAAKRGDRAALSTLLVRHGPAVVRFAHRLCDDPVEAEDVVQDALVAAVRGIGTLRGDAAFTSWLFTITRRAFLRRRRRRRHAPAQLSTVDGVEVATPGPGPAEALADREIGGAIGAAIRTLPPGYREVLILRDVEGLTAPEVAESLGLGVDAVKSRLHRARLHVRERVEPMMTPGGGPACPDVVGQFSRFLEGDIQAEDCARMKAHVEDCPSCNAACASLRRTVGLCHGLGTELPGDVADRVRAALAVVVGRPARGAAKNPEPKSGAVALTGVKQE